MSLDARPNHHSAPDRPTCPPELRFPHLSPGPSGCVAQSPQRCSRTCPCASAEAELGPTYHSWLWCWVSAHALVTWRRAPRTLVCPHLCCLRCLCWSSGCGAWRLAPGGRGMAPHLQGRTDGGSGPVSALPVPRASSVTGDRGWITPPRTLLGLLQGLHGWGGWQGCSQVSAGTESSMGAPRMSQGSPSPRKMLKTTEPQKSGSPASSREPWKSLPTWNLSFALHSRPRWELGAIVDIGSMEHSVMVTGQPRCRPGEPGEPREPLPNAHSGSPTHGSCHCHPMGVKRWPEPRVRLRGEPGVDVGFPPPRAAGLAHTGSYSQEAGGGCGRGGSSPCPHHRTPQ